MLTLDLSQDFRPLQVPARSWKQWTSMLFSVLVTGMLLFRARSIGFSQIGAMLPHSAMFWTAFLAYYLAGPVSEWAIYRRLWHIPASGFLALLRKRVSNEVLMTYSGEISFYLWARRKAGLVTAPFGAIKDVSIVSALAGNIAAIAMIFLAWPGLPLVRSMLTPREALASAAMLAAITLVMLAFRRRIFTLRSSDLMAISRIHGLRLAATTLLAGVLWHSALPSVPLTLWLLLAAVQLLVWRLPLLASKDFAFATVATFLVGHDRDVAAVITLISGLLFMLDLAIGGGLMLSDIRTLASDE